MGLEACEGWKLHVQRILQYDKATGLNSVRELNPSLEATAADLDRQLDEVCPNCQLLLLYCDPYFSQPCSPCMYQLTYLRFVSPSPHQVIHHII